MHDGNPELTREVMSAMLAASPDCVKILSAEGEILYVNARGAELMGLDSVGDITGLHYLDLWLEQDRERIDHAVRQAASGRTARFEACCNNAKHELMCWEVSLAPFQAEGMPAQIVVISRDISEHRQSKIALSASESERQQAELRHQALSELSTRLFDLDDTSDLAYASAEILGRTLNVSRAGYGTIDPIAETITIERDWNAPGIQTIAGTLHFRDYGSYIEDLKRGSTVVFADAYKDPRTAENADKLKAISAQSAVNMPITEQGGFVAIIYTNHESAREWTSAELIFMRDVANRTRVAIERRRAEQELREVAASLEQQVAARTIERDRIWRLSIDLILIVQIDARIVATNPAWTRILGWHEDELIGSNLFDLLHPDDVESTRNEVGRMSEGHVAIQFENRYRRRDGSYCWISWNAFPNDGLIHAVGRDVGSEKEHAHALALAQEQLRQAQKMEAIGKLTGGIAHDFNNLLQVISGNLQLLSNDVAGNERAERRVVNAMAGVSRGSKLASQLLAFGRRQPLAPKVVNLGRLIRDLDDLLRRALGEAIEIETIAAGGLWNTLIDPANVENALLNLAINARDAMNGRGRLTIEAGNASLDDHYVQTNPDAMPGQYVMLAVSDTGCGIPDDIIGQVFEPFFTTKPEGHGTGLGLSMVYGFVKQSGGHIKVYSELGQGTTIKLYLPRSVQTEDVIIDHDSGVVTGGTETILVAEDDLDEGVDLLTKPYTREALAKKLRQVLAAQALRNEKATMAIESPLAVSSPEDVSESTGKRRILVCEDDWMIRVSIVDILEAKGYAVIESGDAAQAINAFDEHPIDLLLTDVGLPDMSGVDLVKALREKQPHLPVIFATGNDMVSGIDLDARTRILQKPYGSDALHQLIVHSFEEQRS